MSDELKPCPKCGQPVTGRLCGGPAAYGCREWDYEVECECGIIWDFSPGDVDEEEAVRRGIEAWNERCERVCRPRVGVGGWFCSECGVFVNNDCIADAQRWIAPRYCPNCGAKIEGGQS